MSWLVHNLWLIPALPLFAAGQQSSGTECRQKVAHGVSRGFDGRNTMSPGGAKESSCAHWRNLSGTSNGIRRIGMSTPALDLFLSPLPGLDLFLRVFPRLTPWATFCRRSAALHHRHPAARRIEGTPQ